MRGRVALAAAWLAVAPAFAATPPLAPGTYRLEMEVVSQADVPVFGAARSTTASTSLVRIAAREDGLEQTHRVCDARLEGALPLVRMEMPARFIAALGAHTYPIALWPDAEGWRYRADLGVEYVGWHPDDSAPLPTRADDPGVYDWDGDGHPAATLRLTVPVAPAGELYVVQRGHSVLDGRVVAPDRVEGHVLVQRFEQAVIGARPWFLKRTPDGVMQDPARSRFVLARVAPGAVCTDVLGAEASR